MEELFCSKLKSIINLWHELVRLAELIDWLRLEAHFAPYYVLQGSGASGVADPAGGGTAFAEAHRGAVGRSGGSALGAGSVPAIYLRGGIFSARLSAGAFGVDAFSPSRGRAGTGDAVARNARGVS
jgi:hypothetical protein